MVHRKFSSHKRMSAEDRRLQRKQRAMAIVVGVLMIVSLAAIAVTGTQPSNPDLQYGEYRFAVQYVDGQAFLVTEVNKQPLQFYYLPQNVQWISSNQNLTELFSLYSTLVVTANPTDEIIVLQDLLRFELSQGSEKLIAGGVTQYNETYAQFPVLTCENVSDVGAPIIVLEQANQTSITVDGLCVQVQTTPNDLAAVRDRLLYSLVGILKE